MAKEIKAGPIRRRPLHPGGIVKTNIEALGMSVNQAALAIGVTRAALGKLVNEKSALSPEMALRLGRFLRTGPDIWLRMQADLDLWDTAHRIGDALEAIEPAEWDGREEIDE
jgi:addiction module HigA family antidote